MTPATAAAMPASWTAFGCSPRASPTMTGTATPHALTGPTMLTGPTAMARNMRPSEPTATAPETTAHATSPAWNTRRAVQEHHGHEHGEARQHGDGQHDRHAQ